MFVPVPGTGTVNILNWIALSSFSVLSTFHKYNAGMLVIAEVRYFVLPEVLSYP